LPRADMTQLRAQHVWYRRSWAPASRVRDSAWISLLSWQRNGDGDRLYAGWELQHRWSFRSAAEVVAYAVVRAPFTDDLVLRGNGDVRIPAQHLAGALFESPRLGAWRFDLEVDAYQEGLSGWAR